eukprot:comp23101_c0_seq8/m.37143 comp23101_c0_seq8/g.37143  ORF comp23101_c0_seq8/g.37143 comp23101_c0_seq8/m.37143 type:complete len:146 (+) comp23101_c0_seq8:282-719(+)
MNGMVDTIYRKMAGYTIELINKYEIHRKLPSKYHEFSGLPSVCLYRTLYTFLGQPKKSMSKTSLKKSSCARHTWVQSGEKLTSRIWGTILYVCVCVRARPRALCVRSSPTEASHRCRMSPGSGDGGLAGERNGSSTRIQDGWVSF